VPSLPQVLLHSSDPSLLLPAAQALRYLLLPLSHSATFIPYLPHTLMPTSDAATLLNDSTSPYLIGVHTSLLSSLGNAGHAISPEVIVADLDKVGAFRIAQATSRLAQHISLGKEGEGAANHRQGERLPDLLP
jgi:hypothetical protein